LNQAVNVRSFPFEFAFRVGGGTDIGVEEEFSCVGVWPVVWNDEFLFFAGLDCFDELFEGAVFADKL
jgi:hypothetical protein